MIDIFEFSFSLHQILTGFLCLFFLYFAWKDQRANTYDKFPTIQLRFLLPSFFVLFVGVFIYLNNYWGYEGIFLSIEFALLVILSVFDTKFAVAFFIYVMISRPWETYVNDMMLSFPRDVFFLVVFSFVFHKAIRKRFYFQWNSASLMLFLFAVWMFFSVVTSSDVSNGLRNYIDLFTKGVLVYFLIVNVVDRKEYVAPIQIAMVIGIFEKACISLYKTFFLESVAAGQRLTSTGILENSNDIAAILILGIPLTSYFFRTRDNKWLVRAISLFIFFLYSILVWKAKSRGALLGVGSLMASYYWIRAKDKKKAMILLGVFGLVLFGLIKSIKRDSSDLEGSTNNRIIYWKSAINMGIRKPIFGVGYNGYNRHFAEYAVGSIGSEGKNRTVHSNWLLPLAEGGIPAFIFYMAFWFYGFRAAYRLRFLHPEYILAIVAYGTTITFLSHTYLLYPYILLGLTISTEQFYSKDELLEENRLIMDNGAI
ncbi:O-antigen ligase family protein [Halobacteriovorax sp.]|uniref:O-antigen ligase family protein n=1 Tax=Halobacteriovorax sp. TaxID=2020862 RepID=UPI0035613993